MNFIPNIVVLSFLISLAVPAQSAIDEEHLSEIDLPEGISLQTVKRCLMAWEGRIRYGYEPYAQSAEVKLGVKDSATLIDATATTRLILSGYVRAITGGDIPYKYHCVVDQSLKFVGGLTYFSIRLDEQARTHKNPKGLFGNPMLPRIDNAEALFKTRAQRTPQNVR